MRLIWPCSSVEDLKQMSGWCEEINNTRCLEEFAHLMRFLFFRHPIQDVCDEGNKETGTGNFFCGILRSLNRAAVRCHKGVERVYVR